MQLDHVEIMLHTATATAALASVCSIDITSLDSERLEMLVDFRGQGEQWEAEH